MRLELSGGMMAKLLWPLRIVFYGALIVTTLMSILAAVPGLPGGCEMITIERSSADVEGATGTWEYSYTYNSCLAQLGLAGGITLGILASLGGLLLIVDLIRIGTRRL